jgi:hypothetical protein
LGSCRTPYVLDGLNKAIDSVKTLKKLRLSNVLGPDNIPVTYCPCGEILAKIDDRDIDDNDVTKRSKIEYALQIIMSN